MQVRSDAFDGEMRVTVHLQLAVRLSLHRD
jgi:hypothetical protein